MSLVAAEVLYFGVGGGVDAFEEAVRGCGGAVERVAGPWEEAKVGVGRRVMRVTWEGAGQGEVVRTGVAQRES